MSGKFLDDIDGGEKFCLINVRFLNFLYCHCETFRHRCVIIILTDNFYTVTNNFKIIFILHYIKHFYLHISIVYTSGIQPIGHIAYFLARAESLTKYFTILICSIDTIKIKNIKKTCLFNNFFLDRKNIV